jgi:hypothetical protein
MSKRNKKFKFVWSNQTDMGKKFGISAIAVGKLLIEEGLKDETTKLATQKALDEGWAKSTPLKDGTPYFMWNINKVRNIISKKHEPLSKLDYWINEVQKNLKQAEKVCNDGNDKWGFLLADCAYDEVPKEIKDEVESKVKEISNIEFTKQWIGTMLYRQVERKPTSKSK